jgi:hypothetical protein
MRTLILLSWLLLPAVVGAAESDEQLKTKAEEAFRRGVENRTRLLQARKHFSEATDFYLELHHRGLRTPALYLNLGNAAVLADRWPTALWAYQLGLKLDPNDARLREHRNFVRKKAGLPASGQGRPENEAWPAWLYRPSLFLLTIIVAVAYSVMCLAFTGAVIRLQSKLLVLSLAALLVTVAAGIALYSELEQAETDQQTPLVVVMDNVPFSRGNGRSYPTHPEIAFLPRGMEARQLYQRGNWLQIRLSTGEIGWVPWSSVLVVKP